MGKSRATLPASSIPALHRSIGRRLESVRVHSRPEVATRLLEVLDEPGIGVREIAKVVRNDLPLAARILRMSNAAAYGQREPITSVERAAVVLGTTRLRALALGVTLDRAPHAEPAQKVHKSVWRESVYRGSLAAATARRVCPGQVSEAFVVGLMLDIGTPVMVRMLGKPYLDLLKAGLSPEKQFEVESRSLPFTHVDVASVLAERWKLPPSLVDPVERHHAGVAAKLGQQPSKILSAIAAYTGALPLDPDALRPINPQRDQARLLLRLDRSDLDNVLNRAEAEFEVARSMLDITTTTSSVDDLIDRLHMRLHSALEEVVAGPPTESGPRVFRVGASRVEVEPGRNNVAVAYLCDSSGGRAASHAFTPGEETLTDIVAAFVLEPAPGDDSVALQAHLARLAA